MPFPSVYNEIFRDATSKANSIGILVDESTDIGSSKNLIVYIRLVELNNGATGQMIADNILEVMDENIIERCKCVGFASDGARSMTGKENGAATILQ